MKFIFPALLLNAVGFLSASKTSFMSIATSKVERNYLQNAAQHPFQLMQQELMEYNTMIANNQAELAQKYPVIEFEDLRMVFEHLLHISEQYKDDWLHLDKLSVLSQMSKMQRLVTWPSSHKRLVESDLSANNVIQELEVVLMSDQQLFGNILRHIDLIRPSLSAFLESDENTFQSAFELLTTYQDILKSREFVGSKAMLEGNLETALNFLTVYEGEINQFKTVYKEQATIENLSTSNKIANILMKIERLVEIYTQRAKELSKEYHLYSSIRNSIMNDAIELNLGTVNMAVRILSRFIELVQEELKTINLMFK